MLGSRLVVASAVFAALALSSAAQDVPSPAMSAGPVVLLGASFAEAWQLPSIGGIPIVNKGLGGQHTYELLARFDRDVVELHPRAVIIWCFVNDMFDAPERDFDRASALARNNFEQMIAKARDAGIEPIVATEIPIRARDTWRDWVESWTGWWRGQTPYHEIINAPVAALNAWLRERAARDQLLLLDLDHVLRDSSGQRSRSSAIADGAHITPAGYEALTAYARPILEQHFAAAR